MKTILKINKPKSNSFIIWEHLLKSAVAFIGTFALLFWGPLFLGSKRRRNEDGVGKDVFIYFIEHPEVTIGLSFVAVLINNFYIYHKNRKTKYIVKIDHDESTVNMELTNLYYTTKQLVEISKKDFGFNIENSVSDSNEKRQKIVFKNISDNTILGEIDTKYFFWAEYMVQLKNVIVELGEYRNVNQSSRSSLSSINILTR
jgi:hypothetical protein